MARIFWDDEDRAKLARETMRVMKESGLGTLSSFQRAQEVLKPEKRRKIPGLQAIAWLAAEMEKQKRIVAAEEIREAELAAAREEGARQARENVTPSMLWPMVQSHIVTAGSGMLKEMLLNVLRDGEILEALGAVFQRPVMAPADLSYPQMPPASEIARAVGRSAAKLAKVVILGLLPGQVNDIRREFQNRFELEFIEADSSHKQLRQHAQNAQFIFSMRFINHADEHQITATARDRYMRIEGGLTRLREALTHVHEHHRLPLHSFRAASATAH